jgi:hypothetical protein
MSQPAIIEVKRPNEVTPLAEVKRPQAGLEKKPGFLKKSSAQWVFFLFFFVVFLGFRVFFVFFVFFYIFAQKREFLGFFSFKNTFRCMQTLNYNHAY